MLSKSEQNYPIYKKELFAKVHTLKKWRCYIEGVKDLTILTNHKLLQFFNTQSKLRWWQTGWIELIVNFDFKLTYCPGCELLQAEALSCIYVQKLQSDGSLDPDWPMYYALMKNNIYPTDVSNKTLKKLVKIKVSSRWTKEPYASRRKMDC